MARSKEEQLELLDAMVMTCIPFMHQVMEKGTEYVEEFCGTAGPVFHRMMGPGMTPLEVSQKMSDFIKKHISLITNRPSTFKPAWACLAKHLTHEQKVDFLTNMPRLAGQDIDNMEQWVLGIVGLCTMNLFDPPQARQFMDEHNMHP
ncbi:MAG: hypothetical protein AMS14_08205 [Planctomycetes bacterium DG_20]|nr:MAG: hypothetical protein AMS14_08205 [Planctomycetes bacterium DG_20]